MVFIVEGIFHAIALSLAGHKAIASFTSGNLPRELIEHYKSKNITLALGYDNDENNAGQKAAIKHRIELRKNGHKNILISQCPAGKDWDDIYKAGKLDDKFLADCLHRGRVNTAESVDEKVYWLYVKRPFKTKVLEFGSKYYSVKVSDFNDELNAAISNASQLDAFDKVGELQGLEFKDALKTETGKKLFYNAVESNTISNCFPQFLFAQVDKTNQEIAYNFSITFPNDSPKRLVEFSGSSLESPASFNKSLLNQAPGATFDGTAYQLKSIRDGWFDKDVLIVDSVPFAGYDKETSIYIYPGFGFHQGKYLKPNKSGFVTAGKFRIKTTLRSINIKTNKTFKSDWVDDFFTIFHYNGLCVLGFFLGSLYAEQLREKLGFFPFLEFTGEAGSGKTTLLEFCWKLLGRRDHEGFNPSKATFAARSRAFAQLSNMPLALIEGDSRDGSKDSKKGGFDFSELKDLFNGRGIRATGVFNRGFDIEEPPFRGSVLIAQNATVDGDEAILTRIVHLHSTRAHQKSENKKMADWFRRVDYEEVNGFLYQALSHENAIIDSIVKHYRRLDEHLSADSKIDHARIGECHALIGAMVNALPIVLPKLKSNLVTECETHLHGRALNRQERLSSDHPTVASFWEIYDLLNVQLVKSDNAAMDGMSSQTVETLNHSMNDDVIAIHLQEFNQACENSRTERLDLKELRKLLPGSQRHKFIGNKAVKSKLREGATRWCAVFKNSQVAGA